MGKITLDLASMFPGTFGDQQAIERQKNADLLQNMQLQEAQRKEAIRTDPNALRPDEENLRGVKFNIAGQELPFESLSPQERNAVRMQKTLEFQLESEAKISKLQADRDKAQTQMMEGLAKRNDLSKRMSIAPGDTRPGPNFLPTIGSLNVPYKEQLSKSEADVSGLSTKFGIAERRLALEKELAGGGPLNQPTQQAPVATQTQMTNQGYQDFKSSEEARASGLKSGDIFLLNGRQARLK